MRSQNLICARAHTWRNSLDANDSLAQARPHVQKQLRARKCQFVMRMVPSNICWSKGVYTRRQRLARKMGHYGRVATSHSGQVSRTNTIAVYTRSKRVATIGHRVYDAGNKNLRRGM